MATDAARRQATLAGIPVRDLTLGAVWRERELHSMLYTD